MRNAIIISLSILGLIAWSARETDAGEASAGPTQTSWVSVSGTVAALADDHFTLDYDGGFMKVSLDGWRLNDEQRYALMQGGRVLVSAQIGDAFFGDRLVLANSIYVDRLGTQMYASGHVDENYEPLVSVDTPARLQLVGVVRSVSGWNLQVETSAGAVEVDTRGIDRVLLDANGFQSLTAGDSVRLSGRLEETVFAGSMRAEVMTRLTASPS